MQVHDSLSDAPPSYVSQLRDGVSIPTAVPEENSSQERSSASRSASRGLYEARRYSTTRKRASERASEDGAAAACAAVDGAAGGTEKGAIAPPPVVTLEKGGGRSPSGRSSSSGGDLQPERWLRWARRRAPRPTGQRASKNSQAKARAYSSQAGNDFLTYFMLRARPAPFPVLLLCIAACFWGSSSVHVAYRASQRAFSSSSPHDLRDLSARTRWLAQVHARHLSACVDRVLPALRVRRVRTQ